MSDSISQKGLFAFFIKHKVAANILMIGMLIMGAFGLYRLNTQFLPTFKINFVTVTVPWIGASAADVERSVIVPLEKRLRDLDGVKSMRSRADYGAGTVIIEFKQGTNMSQAFQDTQQRISTVFNLPRNSEPPIITKLENYELIGRVVITGKDSLADIRQLAYEYENELLRSGISKINITGLPIQELAVKVPQETLRALGMTLPQVANLVDQYSQDASLGTIGKNDVAKDLRMVKAVRTVEALAGIPISNNDGITMTTMGDIAHISFENRSGESLYYRNGQPSVELQLMRTPSENALKVAKVMTEWFSATEASAKARGVDLKLYDQNWILIKQRISLLVDNGLAGLAFIIIILMLFLNRRVAFWVAVGIPVSCLAALYVLQLLGGSINMVSLFAIIMTLGIIVDDTIVVGENAYHEFRNGMNATDAAITSARRMFIPVLASSLTTIAAFLPLMIISEIMGQILFAIPLVVICVIIASLIECFLVLPSHLKHSFDKIDPNHKSKFRTKFDNGFAYFRDVLFASWLKKAVKHRWSVVIVSAMSWVMVICLLVGGHVPFTFFKMPDSNVVKLNVNFVPGTKEEVVQNFLLRARKDLYVIAGKEAKQHSDEPPLVTIMTESLGKTADLRGDQKFETGENVGHLNVELSMPDERSISNNKLMSEWKEQLINTPGITKLVIASPAGGPPGQDIDISLSGKTPSALKSASLFIQSKLEAYPGVENISDNLPNGREEWLLELTSAAKAKGVTVRDISSQIGAAYARQLVQRITEGQDEIDLVVSLTDKNKHSILDMGDLPIRLANGNMVRLDDLVQIKVVRGFNTLMHEGGELTVNVTADVDTSITNANRVLSNVQQEVLSQIKSKFNVDYRLKGKAEEQQQTFSDMLTGLVIGVVLIYLILALVFSSYGWPFLVMVMIPFGLVGAIIGHLIMGYDMTILSMFGLFGLSGIVINDSIILLTTYRELKEKGMEASKALLEAARTRLRPVLLTSITTIVGMVPLLFETSLQAKFLIPMVISIVFGLLFATGLILFFLPCLLAIYEGRFARN
ncbi:efflux RND transporter permease subunit [Francisellaceae bacterium]|nr:efflux RND transporter permease subunit [Francisellaceae bacterium]